MLFARRDGRFASDDESAQVRDRIAQGRGYTRALAALSLEPAYDDLLYFARWVTPEAVRRRFDTRFYLAPVPPGQSIHPQPGEVVDWRWLAPAAALADESFNLVFATRRVLESVAAAPDLDSFMDDARRLDSIEPVLPRIVQEPDGSIRIEI